jgi:hypothetical protein
MYAPGVDPKLGPTVLSRTEVARQLTAARVLKAQAMSAQSSCSESDNPDGFDMRYSHSHQTFVKNAAKDISDSDIGNSIISSPEPSQPEDQDPHQKLVKDAKKRLSVPRSPSAENLTTPKKGKSATRSRAVAGPQTSGKKASTGTANAPQPVKGQESPVAKARHPMETRRRASGAGGLRPGGGSGQTDTCVANGNPSKTWVVIFFLRGGFLPLASQRVQWRSVTTVTRLGTWHAPQRSRPSGPLSGAAKYPAGARPSKWYYVIYIIICVPCEFRPGGKKGTQTLGVSSTRSSGPRSPQ